MPTNPPLPAATRPDPSGEIGDRGPALPLPSSSGSGGAVVPEWVHLLPAGNFAAIDGRAFKGGDLVALVARSMTLAPKGGLPLDYEHAIDHSKKNGREAPAAGWITELAARPDGLWGRVEWTPRGRASVAAREYRFLSPVLMHAPDGAVGAVLRASLTNDPALRQLISLNSAGTPMDLEQLLASLRDALSLPATADASAVVQAVRDMTTAKMTVDPTKFVPIDMFQRAVSEANKGVNEQLAARIVDDAIREHRMMPWMRDWGVELCTANLPAFEKFIGGVGPQVNSLLTSLREPGLRRDYTPPASDGKPQGRELAIAQNLGLTAEDVAKYGK